MSISFDIAFGLIPHDIFWLWVNICSGDGLLPSGNKPLHEPMMVLFYDTIRSFQRLMGLKQRFHLVSMGKSIVEL